MKGALVLITVLVFASMTESFSVRWAKNRVKAFHHLPPHKTAVAQGTIYTNILRSIKNIFQLGLSNMMMTVLDVEPPVTKNSWSDTKLV